MKRIYEMDEGVKPYEYFHKVMGGKWKPYIIRGIQYKGYIRFNEFTYVMGITPKVLKQQLRELEDDGIIRRCIHEVVPPRVDYIFTEAGEKLVPIYDLIFEWSLEQLKKKGEKIAPYSYLYHNMDEKFYNTKQNVSDPDEE
ncbi:MAG: helix-turn-helix transcriptional regulator [Eubacterium sp.]|nr:helix-turn-helix transcriptional regulator [Eubacterium sp.]